MEVGEELREIILCLMSSDVMRYVGRAERLNFQL